MRYIQTKCSKQLSHLHHFLCQKKKIKRQRRLKLAKTKSHSPVLVDLYQRTSASTTSYSDPVAAYLSAWESKHLFFVCFFLITFCQFERLPTGHITDWNDIFVVKHFRGAKTDCSQEKATRPSLDVLRCTKVWFQCAGRNI